MNATLDYSRIDGRHRSLYAFRPPSNTLCGRIWALRCDIPAYTEPKNGQLSAGERDALATKLGIKWTEKVLRGETSCTWHECATYFGTKCYCYKCAKKDGVK